MTARVAVVGSLNMDLVVRSPRIPAPGETVLGGNFFTAPGGKGANQAVAASRVGAQVAMVGRVGADGFGAALLDTLAADGVDLRWVSQDEGAATGVALIVVDDRGQNTIVVASGANSRLSPADVMAADEALAGCDVLLLQLETPLETVLAAARAARRHGARVILNPAPARALPAELLALVDVLVPNESETALLAGMAGDVEGAAEALLAQGVGRMILTLGEQGALLAEPARIERFAAFPVAVVDTTAAGDAFLGALACAVGEGLPLAEAVRWGNAAGALAATRWGAQPSLPRRDEVLRLLA